MYSYYQKTYEEDKNYGYMPGSMTSGNAETRSRIAPLKAQAFKLDLNISLSHDMNLYILKTTQFNEHSLQKKNGFILLV